jgi:serine/threonine protein phosphatase PrpC
MALAQFDCNTAPIKLTFASIGNIEARVFDSPTPINLRVRRGVMGFNAPHPVINEYSWSPDNVLVLHTDGLKTMRNWGDFPELAGATVEYAAQRILQKLVTGNDDATVIVVRKNHTQSGDSL